VKATHLADVPSHTYTHTSTHAHIFIMVARSYVLLHALVVSSCAQHSDWHYLPRGSRHRRTQMHICSHTRLVSWCPHCMKPQLASLYRLSHLSEPNSHSRIEKSLMKPQFAPRQQWY